MDDLKERQNKKLWRLFGGAISLLFATGQFLLVPRVGAAQAVFFGVAFLIAGLGMIYFALFRT